jgi:hypothetical protein
VVLFGSLEESLPYRCRRQQHSVAAAAVVVAAVAAVTVAAVVVVDVAAVVAAAAAAFDAVAAFAFDAVAAFAFDAAVVAVVVAAAERLLRRGQGQVQAQAAKKHLHPSARFLREE